MKPEERALLISMSVRLAKIEALLLYAVPNLVGGTEASSAPAKKKKIVKRAASEVFSADFAKIARRSIELLSDEHPQFREELISCAKEQAKLSESAYIYLRMKYGLE